MLQRSVETVKIKLYFEILCRNCIPASNIIEDYCYEEVKVEESTLPE
jgi:predicted DsbA family dithiol-disulfide isomerase